MLSFDDSGSQQQPAATAVEPSLWLRAVARSPNIPLAVALVFGVPSALMYAIVVVLMVRHWNAHFNNPFSAVFLVRAASVSCILCLQMNASSRSEKIIFVSI